MAARLADQASCRSGFRANKAVPADSMSTSSGTGDTICVSLTERQSSCCPVFWSRWLNVRVAERNANLVYKYPGIHLAPPGARLPVDEVPEGTTEVLRSGDISPELTGPGVTARGVVAVNTGIRSRLGGVS